MFITEDDYIRDTTEHRLICETPGCDVPVSMPEWSHLCADCQREQAEKAGKAARAAQRGTR